MTTAAKKKSVNTKAKPALTKAKPPRTKAKVPRSRAGDPLSRLREVCFSLPEVTEKEAWGEPTFRVREKMFAMFTNDHTATAASPCGARRRSACRRS